MLKKGAAILDQRELCKRQLVWGLDVGFIVVLENHPLDQFRQSLC